MAGDLIFQVGERVWGYVGEKGSANRFRIEKAIVREVFETAAPAFLTVDVIKPKEMKGISLSMKIKDVRSTK